MKTHVAAEIGLAHDGSEAFAHAYIEAVADAGADSVKFQYHDEFRDDEPSRPWRPALGRILPGLALTRHDYWRATSFAPEVWRRLLDAAHRRDLQFGISVYGLAAHGALSRYLEPDYWKIPHTAVDRFLDHELLQRPETVISTPVLPERSGIPGTTLLTVPKYPIDREEALAAMPERFPPRTGWSNHCPWPSVSEAALTRGVAWLEVHVTFDMRIMLPDTSSSVTLEDLRYLCEVAHG